MFSLQLVALRMHRLRTQAMIWKSDRHCSGYVTFYVCLAEFIMLFDQLTDKHRLRLDHFSLMMQLEMLFTQVNRLNGTDGQKFTSHLARLSICHVRVGKII
jgi:hypothetical protein